MQLTYKMMHRLGSLDVAGCPDQERVEFLFVYGRPDGEEHDITKSIYALASTGAREFHFHVLGMAIQHEPPIPLLPPEVSVGSELQWEGTVTVIGKSTKTTAHMRVEAVESAGIIRTRTTYSGMSMMVTRRFQRGVGLVGMEVGGTTPGLTLRLLPSE